MVGLNGPERFGREDKKAQQEAELEAANTAVSGGVIILFRGFGEVAGKKVEPWALPEVKKAIDGLLIHLRSRQQLSTRLGFSGAVKIDQIRIAMLEGMLAGINESHLSDPGTLNQLKIAF